MHYRGQYLYMVPLFFKLKTILLWHATNFPIRRVYQLIIINNIKIIFSTPSIWDYTIGKHAAWDQLVPVLPPTGKDHLANQNIDHLDASCIRKTYLPHTNFLLRQLFFRTTQTFCSDCALTISVIDKRFFASKRKIDEEKSLRSTFFDFDPFPEILSDIDILKLHYSMSDFPNPWINTA